MSENNSVAQFAQTFRHHPLYPEFVQVKNRLEAAGFVCWIAGGAVRDILLERKVADFDLVTDATTEQLLQIFPDALTVGAQFGVVKIIINKIPLFDLATFRRESDYEDGRRPSKVDFATPAEDSQRRDFTVNALFWNDHDSKIVDFVGGLKDLENKTLRCVGVAKTRFEEDHLRLLRLLRFSVQLGFSIEPQTLEAAFEMVAKVQKVSGERIWAELQKMLPSVEWKSFLENQLAQKVLEELLHLKVDVTKVPVSALGPNRGLPHFFFILLKLGSYTELQKILKTTWHLSNDDLKIMDALNFGLTHQLSIPEWMYEAERNPVLIQVLEFLNFVGNKAHTFTEFKNRFESRPEKLVDGNDLMGLVEPQKMGEALKEIRLRQFEQPDLDKTKILKNLLIKTKSSQ